MSEPGLISVRTQVVLDTLVGSIADTVAARLDEPLDPAVEAMLGDGRLERMGYLARAIEIERFERAREPMPWLAERARGSIDAATLARELAATEPDERPDPDDERAVSWKVPGPGGHVRHYVALRAGADVGTGGKRAWLTGFLVHCIREVAPER